MLTEIGAAVAVLVITPGWVNRIAGDSSIPLAEAQVQ